jgi:hypothetical protein
LSQALGREKTESPLSEPLENSALARISSFVLVSIAAIARALSSLIDKCRVGTSGFSG